MGAVRTLESGEAAPSLEARFRETVASPLRVLVIVGLLAFVLLGLPELLDTFWLQIMTSVVIYSVVTLGLGLLSGLAFADSRDRGVDFTRDEPLPARARVRIDARHGERPRFDLIRERSCERVAVTTAVEQR